MAFPVVAVVLCWAVVESEGAEVNYDLIECSIYQIWIGKYWGPTQPNDFY